MKNIVKFCFVALMATVMLSACAPNEQDDHSLGRIVTVTESDITYSSELSSRSDNVIIFTNTTDLGQPFVAEWDFGNGAKSKALVAEALYPTKGEYTVSLTLYTANGSMATKSWVVNIAQDDFSLISTPVYTNLTGEFDDADGKTWVMDQYNNFTSEVVAALTDQGKLAMVDIRGHMGLGPAGSYSQNWWGASSPSEKLPWLIYATKFNFKLNGLKLNIETDGKGYGRSATTGGFDNMVPEGYNNEDASFDYDGGDYTFSILEAGDFPSLTISDDGYMGYQCGTQVYEIIYQTDKVMALRAYNPVENQDWVFVYCLEEYNIGAKPQAVPLADDFEDDDAALAWVAEDMGALGGVSDNPRFAVNSSSKVYRYQKGGMYSNLSVTADGYTFDLTAQNKIRVKVYIPSDNDFSDDSELLSQLAVKLQNSKAAEPWASQTELIKEVTQFDEWVELEFDFSAIADNTSYDKIVLQFGGEGHSAEGLFYLDDFSFNE